MGTEKKRGKRDKIKGIIAVSRPSGWWSLLWKMLFRKLYIYIYIYIYIYTIKQDAKHSQFPDAEPYGFEFGIFLLLDWLPYQDWNAQSAQQFTHSWRRNNWISFPKVLALREMDTPFFRPWTWVTVSFS